MRLQSKVSPASHSAASGASGYARQLAFAARSLPIREGNGVRDHLDELLSQLAALELLAADLPEEHQRLAELVAQLSESVVGLAKIPRSALR